MRTYRMHQLSTKSASSRHRMHTAYNNLSSTFLIVISVLCAYLILTTILSHFNSLLPNPFHIPESHLQSQHIRHFRALRLRSDKDPTTLRPDTCARQPLGAGPVPSPDTASAFLSWTSLSNAASAAIAPAGYVVDSTNQASTLNGTGFLGTTELAAYRPKLCALSCDNTPRCGAFELYFERSPILAPGLSCKDPPSSTLIRCSLWDWKAVNQKSRNVGQWREHFQVVIAGANRYVKSKRAPTVVRMLANDATVTTGRGSDKCALAIIIAIVFVIYM
ncbi:hypothetical protein EJ05DRAFT_235574 [Pseudovirgaria hyperparasitica]|uniref:Apple domain-containing protein n=1 Tax=Pseudovirgaria hyperparasitica TaxID=470096 RepID=A0A6A6VQE9_9PEZI|nr:uncharacterized protein EJ05DRAFT_235574 [Pseudovirgaria hyperparasitica]KAF2752868.1 hypothetical protein EJ05DRAFT_235574 [Pseudovirgaria hyperparasitica]